MLFKSHLPLIFFILPIIKMLRTWMPLSTPFELLFKALQCVFTRCLLSLGSSQTRTSTTYKPGGTGIVGQGNIAGRIKNHDNDPYGRWTTVYLQGKSNKTIVVISVYQICTRPTNKIRGTACHQQEAAFIQQRHDDFESGFFQ